MNDMKSQQDRMVTRALAKYGRFNRVLIAVCIVTFILLCIYGGN